VPVRSETEPKLVRRRRSEQSDPGDTIEVGSMQKTRIDSNEEIELPDERERRGQDQFGTGNDSRVISQPSTIRTVQANIEDIKMRIPP